MEVRAGMTVIDDPGPGRYPDAFPAGAPFEMLSQKQAKEALEAARRILTLLAEKFDGDRE
jgi:HEPN domain-containing protein